MLSIVKCSLATVEGLYGISVGQMLPCMVEGGNISKGEFVASVGGGFN